MPLNSCASTLAALLVAFATPATASSADPSDLSPAYEYDNVRGSGLPHCECNAYHNGAFPWMSRMCEQPFEEGERVVCYPTRVGHPGTVLNGRFYVNNCNHGQTMCSPWTRPEPEPEPEPGTQIRFRMSISMGRIEDNGDVAFYQAALENSVALKDALAGLYGVSADMIQIVVTNVVDNYLPYTPVLDDSAKGFNRGRRLQGFGASAILIVTITAPDEDVQAVVNAIGNANYNLLETNSAINTIGILEPFVLNNPPFGIRVAGEPL